MSLLLKALQNAAKNREAAAAGAQANAQPIAATQEAAPATSSSELSLEPVQQPTSRAQPQSSMQPQSAPRTPPAYGRSQTAPLADDAGERAAPSPSQAQNVLRAATPPRRAGVVHWISERPLFAFSTAAGLFAIGYGVYLYLQITNPGVFVARPVPPPAPPAVAQAVPPSPAVAPAALPPQSVTPGATPTTPAVPGPIASIPAAPATAAAPATSSPAPAGTAPIAGLPGPGTPQSAPPAATAPGPALVTASPPPVAAAPSTALKPAAAATRPSDVAAPGSPAAASATTLTARPAARPRAATPARRESPEGVAPAAGSQIVPVDANVASAYQALEKGQLNDAERLYRQALTSNPGSVDAMLGLASTLAQQNRADAATHLYMRVLEQEPRNSYAQAGLLALGGRADPVAAEARLKQLISREPSAFLHFTLGNLYSEQGQWAAAQGAYFQAHTLAPDNPDYAFNLAVGLEHLSQPRIALDYYRRALALAQTRGNAQFDPARVQSRIRSLETALVHNP